MKLVITVLSWGVSLGMALALYLQGCLFYPLLVCAGSAASEWATRRNELAILGMVPVSVVSLLCFMAQPGLSTLLGFGFYAGFWYLIYKHFLGMLKFGIRRDKCMLTANIRKALYHKFDYFGLASTALPPATQGKPEKGQVLIVRTCMHNGERLNPHDPAKLEDGEPFGGEVAIYLDPSVRFQTCVGFGGAFTETSAELLTAMGSASQERIIDAYFNENSGIGYQCGRLHMNSCDFSKGNWSCCEENDKELKSFSIAHYDQAILPMVKRAAKAAGRQLTLLGSPWSPPAWMKDTAKMLDGGKLKPDCREAWAKHFVLFAEKLKEAGFPLWGFTVQNEPNAANGWENCLFSAEEERDFIRDHLGPALEKSSLGLKLLAWDHNRDDLFRRAYMIEKDPKAAEYVYGYGYHWYGDVRYDWWADSNDHSCFENVRAVHDLCPEKHLWITEVCQELGSHIGDWGVAERYAETLVRDFNNGTEAFLDWNLILDQDGGYNHRGNQCSAPVIVDAGKDRVLFQPSFFYIGHFSRYIKPGARRILSSSSRSSLEVLSVANPDGTIVVVVFNQTSNGTFFCLRCEGRIVRYYSEPRSITTMRFLGRETGSAEAKTTGPDE